MIDAFTLLTTTEITNILGSRGHVKLIDVSPRLVPEGWTPEFRIAQTARISYNGHQKLRTPKEEGNLTKFLYKNHHMSPFEMVDFIFEIECPIFVQRQFVRHRTHKMNEMSLRYVEAKEEHYYNPLEFEDGIRTVHPTNKQGSVKTENPHIIELFEKANSHLKEIYSTYQELVDAGCAREVARTILPVSHYTVFNWKMDLRNLLGFFNLRCSEHAQLETRLFAQAMKDLIAPLIPICIQMEIEQSKGLLLTPTEIRVITEQQEISTITSKSEREECERKLKILNCRE